MHLEPLLLDLAIIFGVAVAVVLGLARLGFPPIAGFLLAGILVGPGALGLVSDLHQVEQMAELGVALLLFTIGLEFSLQRLRNMGRWVALGGGLQVGLTVGVAVGVALAVGASARVGVFWGYVAALSSTAIVLRALADRGEIAAPHGRFVVAVLIFQDLCIVPMMLTLPLLAGGGGSAVDLALTLGKAAAVVVVILFLARFIVPRVLHRVAATRRRELFLLTVLLIGIGVAVGTAEMGLSLALGAFLAGVIIADTEFVHQAASDVGPFRDALASVFFVSIGMLLDPAVLIDSPGVVLGLVTVLLVGKFAVTTLAALVVRFPMRAALLAGVALAQVGEFSFVLLRTGEQSGLVPPDQARVFIAASVLTMIATPLLVAVSPRIGAAGAALLRPLERLWAPADLPEEAERVPMSDHVVVAGLGLAGQLLVTALENAGVPYVALELNPDTVAHHRRQGHNVRYGDVSSLEVLDHVADAGRARVLVLLLSDADAARRCVAEVTARWPRLNVVVRAHRSELGEKTLAGPGVEVVSEDYETALEIVERVLHRVGGPGGAMSGVVAAARGARDDHGARRVEATGVVGAMVMDAVVLGASDRAVGGTIAASGLRSGGGALVVAVSRGDHTVTAPDAGEMLAAGDVAFLVGTRAQIDRSRQILRGEDAGREPGSA